MILGLTSDKYGPDKLYDEASTVIQQKLSQIQGVGQVNVGGGALPSVRVEVNPTKLASYGLTMTNVQSVLRLQNTDLAKGQITDGNICGGHCCQRPNFPRRGLQAARRRIQKRRGHPPFRRRRGNRLGAECAAGWIFERQARGDVDHLPPARREYY